jgi:hypothetical protein
MGIWRSVSRLVGSQLDSHQSELREGLSATVYLNFILCAPRQRCPLWVKSEHMRRNKSCPLYPRQRPRKRTPAEGHVRFTPGSGHELVHCTCPLWANSGLMQCSKKRSSIRSPHRRGRVIDSLRAHRWCLGRQPARTPHQVSFERDVFRRAVRVGLHAHANQATTQAALQRAHRLPFEPIERVAVVP